MSYLKSKLKSHWHWFLYAFLFLLFIYNLSSMTLSYQFDCEKLEANYVECKTNQKQLYGLIPLSEQTFRVKNVTIEEQETNSEDYSYTIYELYLHSDEQKFLYDYSRNLEDINERKNALETAIKSSTIDDSLDKKNIYPNLTNQNMNNFLNFIFYPIFSSLITTFFMLMILIVFSPFIVLIILAPYKMVIKPILNLIKSIKKKNI